VNLDTAPTADSAPYAAVVVNYEAGPALGRCVASLLADDSAGAPPAVVVVDHGSTDGSVAALRAEYPSVTVVHPAANRGYAAGANAGIAACDHPVVAVCNPDLEVAPGTAAALLARFDEPTVGAAGPRIRAVDGTTYPSARLVPSPTVAVGHALCGAWWASNPWSRRYRQLDRDPDLARDVDWVSGAAVWLRRAALDAVGGWDEGYFMYAEDLDLCWRLRAAGWRVVYEPGGSVVHLHALSTGRHPYRMIVAHHRSTLRFAAKRWRGPARVVLLPAAAAVLAVRAAVQIGARALTSRRKAPRADR
jgi:N-acetylglucosaminyl-diphospho-decaprenol L-rhamnosyltransferase